jgi:hypothetical protein
MSILGQPTSADITRSGHQGGQDTGNVNPLS